MDMCILYIYVWKKKKLNFYYCNIIGSFFFVDRSRASTGKKNEQVKPVAAMRVRHIVKNDEL